MAAKITFPYITTVSHKLAIARQIDARQDQAEKRAEIRPG